VRNKKRLIFGLVVLAVAVIVYVSGIWKSVTLARMQEHRLYLENLVEQQYVFSVFVYLAIFMGATIVGVPITVLLTIAAGAFFGVLWGTVYANIGATGGAIVSFLLFRYFLGSVMQKKYAGSLAQLNKNIEQYGHNYLLTLQLLPFTPTLLINTLAGLTKISLWTFVWTTSVGILPGSLIYTFAGRQLAQLRSVENVASGGMLFALILLALLALTPLLMGAFKQKYNL